MVELSNNAAAADSNREAENERDSVTAIEYIQQQTELEDEARELFNRSIDTCTWSLGPRRQNLFVCLTCEPASNEKQRGGICYACSIRCHGKHQLLEINAKRNFQCDCGTDRLGSAACNIRKTHDIVNSDNVYGQNFDGLFCKCHRRYDPNSEENMFQCLVCEDWFHESCIQKMIDENVEESASKTSSETANETNGEAADADNAAKDLFNTSITRKVPSDAAFDYLICTNCIQKKVPFIASYRGIRSFQPKHESENGLHTSAESPNEPNKRRRLDTDTDRSADGVITLREQQDDRASHSANAEPDAGEQKENSQPDVSRTESACKLPQLQYNGYIQKNASFSLAAPMFVQEAFREDLCYCKECLAMYEDHPMLLEDEDIYEPPEDDDSDTGSIYEAGERALHQMPREKAIEGVLAYQKLRDALSGFLRPYAEGGKVVTKEDVERFFSERKAEEAEILKQQLGQ